MLLFEPLAGSIINALTIGVMMTSGQAVQKQTYSNIYHMEVPKIETVSHVEASTISVSCIKVQWEAEEGRNYWVSCYTEAGYVENMYFEFRDDDTCYITGLREGSDYEISVEPMLKENEEAIVIPKKIKASTEKVEVIWEFPHEDGWTNAFTGEIAGGLTAMPASGAIYGSVVDPVTHTGIRRDEYGDYCVAMGLFYGHDWDRYLVELENGTQFTVKQCDSKGWADDGEGKYHWFGGEGNGKSIIEFIYDDNFMPSCVAFYGSWGYWNWSGLNLCSNIKSIKKINYGKPIEY